jgi:hypothetical protein
MKSNILLHSKVRCRGDVWIGLGALAQPASGVKVSPDGCRENRPGSYLPLRYKLLSLRARGATKPVQFFVHEDVFSVYEVPPRATSCRPTETPAALVDTT